MSQICYDDYFINRFVDFTTTGMHWLISSFVLDSFGARDNHLK